jgi:hypothetical protein
MSSGSRSRTRAGLALSIGLALAVPALAQDKEKPDERPVTEGMLKDCPDLRGAEGKKRAQLLALFFELDWKKAGEPATRKKVGELFDLTDAGDGALLEGYLAEKGAHRCQGGLRAVVAASGAPGLRWVFRVFEKKGAPPERLGRLLDTLFAVHFREALAFLVKCLADKTVVPDWKAKQEAPLNYKDLRVCDHALRTIAARLTTQEDLTPPKEAGDGRGFTLTPEAKRDEQIAALQAWLAADPGFLALLNKEPSVLDGLEGDDKKDVAKTLERLGIDK